MILLLSLNQLKHIFMWRWPFVALYKCHWGHGKLDKNHRTNLNTNIILHIVNIVFFLLEMYITIKDPFSVDENGEPFL